MLKAGNARTSWKAIPEKSKASAFLLTEQSPFRQALTGQHGFGTFLRVIA
jgi:hypothetical protein